jgi:hypothetical protein
VYTNILCISDMFPFNNVDVSFSAACFHRGSACPLLQLRVLHAEMPATVIQTRHELTRVAGYENQVRKAQRKVTSKWARNVRRPYPIPFRLPSIPPHSKRAPVALGSCSSPHHYRVPQLRRRLHCRESGGTPSSSKALLGDFSFLRCSSPNLLRAPFCSTAID